MPNWCYNNIDIIGERSELQKFADATKTVTEDGTVQYELNHLFPIPQELRDTKSIIFTNPEEQAKQHAIEAEMKAKHGWKDWYDWACDNWGTKWGVCDFDWNSLDEEMVVEPNATYISAYYQTAWSPADGLIRHISGLFPELIFSVVSTEEGDAFACFSIFRNGLLVAEDGEEPEMPEALQKLSEEDDDSFYEQLMDWRGEVSDKWSEAADRALGRLILDKK